MDDLYGNFLCVEIRLAVICDSCNHAIPVNGVVSKVKCNQCQEITKLSGRLRWSEILNYQNPKINIFEATLNHKPGKGDYGAWSPVKLNTKRIWPVCHNCKNEYDKETVVKASKSENNLHCQKCNTLITIQKPPPLLKEPFSVTRYIIGGTAQEIETNSEKINSSSKNAKPVVMACMSCGGTLIIDGTKRLVECKFCQSSNYLPDGLWLSLHPASKRNAWYVIFDASKAGRN